MTSLDKSLRNQLERTVKEARDASEAAARAAIDHLGVGEASAPAYPWYWNPGQQFALAQGISCYRAGLEYAHGGLSLQECLLLSLAVATTAAKAGAGTIQIRDVVWQGMRCKVAMEGTLAGLRLDLRTHAGNPSTSVVRAVRPFKPDGSTSVVVDDEDMAGQEATIVIVGDAGNLLAQAATKIGE